LLSARVAARRGQTSSVNSDLTLAARASPCTFYVMPSRNILLVANGDLRQSANEKCWPAQAAMEKQLAAAIAKLGHKVVRAHPYKPKEKHGFIGSQKEGMAVFAGLDPKAPLIV